MTAHLFTARAQLHRRAVPSREYLDFIRSSGLGARSLADPDPLFDACGCVAVTAVKADWDGTFAFAERGAAGSTVAVVIEAFGRDGSTPLDLVAFSVAEPNRCWTMFGRAPMLGLANVYAATTYQFDQPLRVHRTVLAWIQGGCRGAVVLDPKFAARNLLDASEMGRIAGEDRAHTIELANLTARLFDRDRFVVPAEPKRRVAA